MPGPIEWIDSSEAGEYVFRMKSMTNQMNMRRIRNCRVKIVSIGKRFLFPLVPFAHEPLLRFVTGNLCLSIDDSKIYWNTKITLHYLNLKLNYVHTTMLCPWVNWTQNVFNQHTYYYYYFYCYVLLIVWTLSLYCELFSDWTHMVIHITWP